MVRQSWRTELKAAQSERDALGVVRAWLGEWSQGEIAALPPHAWPGRIDDRADVLAHAAVLAGLHACFEGNGGELRGVQELLLFFTHAAVRIARIASEEPAADPPPRTRVAVGAGARRKPNRRRTSATRRR
jgi:hypothetical protein